MPSHEGYIASAANPRVKAWAKLKERKYREREGRFLLEGVHLVKEALQAGWPLACVVYDAGCGVPDELAVWAQADGNMAEESRIEAQSAGPVPYANPAWIPVSPEVIARCSQSETPQPVFAVALKRDRQAAPSTAEETSDGLSGLDIMDALPSRSRETVTDSPLDWGQGVDRLLFDRGSALVAVLDGVQDPGNVGTIIRSAAACGATAVVLGRGTADLYNAKTLRATMGALFYVSVFEADLAELLPQAQESGLAIVGASLQASRSCYECDFRRGVWLVFGNEGSGLSPAVSASVNDHIIIPMTGHAESLNVAMAATVLLFEAQRQRRAFSQ